MSKYSPKQIKERLAAFGLKVTHQRIAIYEAMLEADNHPTADDIYSSISRKYPSISLGTIYKTLETFVENNLIRKVFTQKDVMRYEAKIDDHYHLYCTKSDEIIDFHDKELTKLLAKYFKKKEIPFFRIKDFQLQINGEKVERQQKLDF